MPKYLRISGIKKWNQLFEEDTMKEVFEFIKECLATEYTWCELLSLTACTLLIGLISFMMLLF